MRDNTTPPEPPLSLTKREVQIFTALRHNPLMAERIAQLIGRYEKEIADGMDAHHAEEAFIEELQNLGTSMMQEWAKVTQEKALEQLSFTHQKHSKKNSNGTPPLD